MSIEPAFYPQPETNDPRYPQFLVALDRSVIDGQWQAINLVLRGKAFLCSDCRCIRDLSERSIDPAYCDTCVPANTHVAIELCHNGTYYPFTPLTYEETDIWLVLDCATSFVLGAVSCGLLDGLSEFDLAECNKARFVINDSVTVVWPIPGR
jgi:hypothetical protein